MKMIKRTIANGGYLDRYNCNREDYKNGNKTDFERTSNTKLI